MKKKDDHSGGRKRGRGGLDQKTVNALKRKLKFSVGQRVKFVGIQAGLTGKTGVIVGISDTSLGSYPYKVNFEGAAMNPWYCTGSEISPAGSSQSWLHESI